MYFFLKIRLFQVSQVSTESWKIKLRGLGWRSWWSYHTHQYFYLTGQRTKLSRDFLKLNICFFLWSKIFQPQHYWYFGFDNPLLLGVIPCTRALLAHIFITTKNVSRCCYPWLRTVRRYWKAKRNKLHHNLEINPTSQKPHTSSVIFT